MNVNGDKLPKRCQYCGNSQDCWNNQRLIFVTAVLEDGTNFTGLHCPNCNRVNELPDDIYSDKPD